MASFSRLQLESWLKEIEIEGNHIADIGAAQNSLQGRTKTWSPDSYVIFDLEQPHETKVKNWIKLDIQTDVIPDKWIEGFDTIFMLEVSEYLFNPFKALQNINKLLDNTGDAIFYSSWHFFYPIHNPPYKDFLRYTPDGVNKLLKETGFGILEHRFRYLEDNLSIGQMLDIISTEKMRPRKDPPINIKVIGSLVKAVKR